MNHNLPPQEPEQLNMKHVSAFGCFFSVIGSVICAMNHDLKWLIIGVICFTLNLYNYLREENKEGE